MVIRNFRENIPLMFIHVPKTGGCTIEHLIFKAHYNIKKTVDYYNPEAKKQRQEMMSIDGEWAQHFSLLKNIQKYSIKDHEKYFKFAFVRNPWDRAYSEYLYMKKMHCECNQEEAQMSFKDYIKNNFKCSWRDHVSPQYEFLVDSSGEIAVDFLGKFENFQEDLGKVLRKIGADQFEKIPLINKTRTIMEKNKNPYWLYYDDETQEIVGSKYKKDVDLFGYNFLGSA